MGTLARSLADLAAQLTALTATRLELFGLEAQEARDRLLYRLGALLLAVAFLLLALLVASLTVAVVFWPTEHRVLALALLALFYAVLGVGLLLWLRARSRQDPVSFAATIEVLRADAQEWAGAAVSARSDAPDPGVAQVPGAAQPPSEGDAS
ncbi:Putative membrane protein YqjE OS=Castellaniella defragrans OX=75697 GN=HNR28_000741 PE=4 SV=1 [Castellaniella defragrans]